MRPQSSSGRAGSVLAVTSISFDISVLDCFGLDRGFKVIIHANRGA